MTFGVHQAAGSPCGTAPLRSARRSAAAEAQAIVVCVSDHNASISLLRTDEVASALHGRLLVQLSTVTAEESRELGRWAEEI